ncbi:pyridoxamine 5'-phosphate oxidase family protein [Streptomyces sp. NPDC058374]|uniref:pyridoxamine 5'-phosphate oxidase family protein n=1 Tax=unclassified Streptomyces TaxID=2593676 RepID=UPI003658F41C
MALGEREREEFLAGNHVASLAVERGAGRGPLTVPIWYWYEPGGEVRVITGADSVKARLISAAGRFSLLVQRTAPTYLYVSVDGPLVSTAPTTVADMVTEASRYLDAEGVDDYVSGSGVTDTDPAGLLTLTMHPEHWLSADLGWGPHEPSS